MAKILIIDDELGLCEVVKDFFTKRGYQVVYALTGQGGLDAFSAERPNIVMLDLYLKDMNGKEVLKKIKQEQQNCTIIIITGSAWQDDKWECLKLDADFYMNKPLSMKELLKHLDEISPSAKILDRWWKGPREQKSLDDCDI